MEETLTRDERPRQRGAVPAALAVPCLVGPLIFTAGFLVQPLCRRGEYDSTAEAFSDLEAGPGGWVQQLNFVVLGLLMVAFAVGLHGLAQRVVLAIWLICILVLAVRLRRLARATSPGET